MPLKRDARDCPARSIIGGVDVKGLMFNVLEEVITDAYGPEAWDSLLCMSGAEGAYSSLGTYSDNEFHAIAEATATLTGQTASQVLQAFGQSALPIMVRRFPTFMEGVSDTRTFLLSLNSAIHPEIRKIFAGAACPHFKYAIGDDVVQITYYSRRRFCDIAQGLARGTLAHFGEAGEVTHPECLHEGAEACRLDVRWAA